MTMKGPTSPGDLTGQSEQSPPTEQTEPSFQHPADQSWLLQMLLDLKESFGRVDGRTEVQTKRIEGLAEELSKVRGEMLTSRTARWLVALVVSVIIGVGSLIYHGMTRDRVQSNYPLSSIPERTKLSDPALAQPQPSHPSPPEEQETVP